ncbi:MAG: hypothetical protein QM775_27350 [Pirellulales bacterium]
MARKVSGSVAMTERELVFDAVDDVERRSSGLQDRLQHAPFAVDPYDVGLRSEAVAHVGDVANINRAGADALDR